jgi:site-specific recombinase XerD
MRKVCAHASEQNLIKRNPFKDWALAISTEPVNERIHLEIAEITHFKNAELPADFEVHRRSWLFCFYAGFYYSDLLQLQWSDIKKSDRGFYIDGSRFKNDQSYIAPIHTFKNAVKILAEQRKRFSKSSLVFPGLITEQKYNKRLKKLAEIVGLEKNLMNKTARHSHIQFWIAQGLDAAMMQNMVGHKNFKTTQAYFDLQFDDVRKSVKRIDVSICNL